ncbi:MAG: hypothetical protein ACTHN0_08015, partial [Aquihabitans sp.]
MSRTTTSIATTAAALALVLGLAACGSSSGSDTEKKTTTTEASGGNQQGSTTTSDDDTSTTEEDATTTVVATGGGEFCEDLADFINEQSSSDIDVTDPAAYKKAIEESSKAGKDLLSKAPDELDDSVETILDAQDQLIAELEKVDYDFTKLGPDALSSMGTPEVTAAGEKLDAYVT